VSTEGRFVIQQRLTDRRDFALLGSTPALMQPRFGALSPLVAGHRYVVGRGGLYVEARSAVMHAVACVAPSPVALPFGEVTPFLNLPDGGLPRDLIGAAVGRALACVPDEWAGVVVYEASGYRLVEPEALSRSAGHVSYARSGLDEETVVVDLHSHGAGAAFFSAQDDEDDTDRGGFYLALVLGEVTAARVSVAARLVVHGHFATVTAAIGLP
jgi:PRTRC genetic system protein A